MYYVPCNVTKNILNCMIKYPSAKYNSRDNFTVIELLTNEKMQHDKYLGFPSYSSLLMEIPGSVATKVMSDQATLDTKHFTTQSCSY